MAGDFSTGNLGGQQASLGGQVGTESNRRLAHFRRDDGMLVGGNFEIPNGDFARILGYRPPTEAELNGQAKISGGRTIELALQREIAEVGDRASLSGTQGRNTFISWGNVEAGGPGRTRHIVADGIDSVAAGPDRSTAPKIDQGQLGSSSSSQYMRFLNEYHVKSKEDNMRYLEMQYKFDFASKSFGTISNLMKVRNEAVRSSIRDVAK